jgi:hypothetical protein
VISVRRLANRRELGRFDLSATADQPTALAISPDESRVIVGTNRGVVLMFRLGPLPTEAIVNHSSLVP